MFQRIFRLFFLILGWMLSGPVWSVACNEAAGSLLLQGHASFKERLALDGAVSALQFFQQAAAADTACESAFLMSSQAAWWVGDRTEDRREQLKAFQLGMDMAKETIRLSSAPALGRYWLAANMGSFGEAKGVLKSLFLVKPIRHELEEILKLDPTFDRGAAQRVLGAVDYKVPGFAGGSKTRALAHLTKAIELGPNVGFNRFYLAEYYFTVGEKKKAVEQLDLLNQLSAPEEEQPELILMQEKGRELRKKIKV